MCVIKDELANIALLQLYECNGETSKRILGLMKKEKENKVIYLSKTF